MQPAGAAPLTAQVSDWASRQRRLSTDPTARKLLPEGGGGGQPAEQQQQPAAVKRLDKAALKALRSKRTVSVLWNGLLLVVSYAGMMWDALCVANVAGGGGATADSIHRAQLG